MKPGAFAILMVPLDFSRTETYEDPSVTSPKERAKHFMQYDHKRLYGTDFLCRLKKAGFLIPENNFLYDLKDELRTRYALPTSEYMYGYIKPPAKENK